jgi:hypothetical protein
MGQQLGSVYTVVMPFASDAGQRQPFQWRVGLAGTRPEGALQWPDPATGAH